MNTSFVVVVLLASMLTCGRVAFAGPSDWYEFKPTNENGPSVIGMEDWLDAPAGNHGPVRVDGDRFVFEDGTRVKFWGINLGGSDCTPSHEDAEYWAERYARYGINAVRLHKPWDALYAEDDSTALDPEAVEKLDYFCNELRKRGIYYAWSFFYHHRLRGKDLEKVWYPEELQEAERLNIYGMADYLPDVQNILIEATLNLLEHENPYTEMKYADDPALVSVEFQNEASALFWSGLAMPELPQYQAYLSGKFTRWLRHKYCSQQDLVAAWGEQAMDAFDYKGEHLDRGNVYCHTNANMMSPGGLEEAARNGLWQRMVDNAEFLHEIQNEYYGRFADRVRAAGYAGPLVGSCWRGKGGITEYYNLRSDWLVGVIDRHNYHGGLRGWRPRTGEQFGNKAQVNTPGGGLFSSGMVQAADRPYAFSEWASVFPNEWTLESPSIIAVYGMGLQDWDASYQFAARTTGRGYSEALHVGNLLWNIERPENLGLYPNIARMIYRGDVQPGEVISVRRVSVDDLRRGRLPWGEEGYSGWHDIKTYEGPMPGEALAAGRLVVEFTPEAGPSVFPEMSQYEAGGVTTSCTGQLAWDVSRGGRGFFTVNTPGTRALVGFAPDGPVRLGSVSITLQDTPFAGVYVSSLAQDRGVDEAGRLLVTAMARTRNTGMEFNEERDVLLDLGEPPILVEPVKAQIAVEGREIEEVRLLDHDGRRTDRVLPVQDGRFTIDGARDRTMYYQVVLK